MIDAATDELLSKAQSCCQSGDWKLAENHCQAVLRDDANNVAALHLLAAISLAMKDHAAAIDYGLQAARLAPNVASIHNNLGNAYRESGHYANAARQFEIAQTLDVNSAGIRHNLAMLYETQGELSRAEGYYRQALACDPEFVASAQNLGRLLSQQNRFREAIDVYRPAAEIQPDAFAIHYNLGNALAAEDEYELAIASYEDALRLAPHMADIHNNIGTCWQATGEFRRALLSFEQGAQLAPENADVINNHGSMLQFFGKFKEAAGCLQRAIELKPDFVGARINLANLAVGQGEFAKADVEFKQVLAIAADSREAKFNRALAWLRAGNFERGWPAYESRFLKQVEFRDFGFPVWNGESVAGQRLLVIGEQGLGDEVMFASYVPKLHELGVDCVIECDNRLQPIFARSFEHAAVIGRRNANTRRPLEDIDLIDFQVSAGSLPQFLSVGTSTGERQQGYLRADVKRIEEWKQRLDQLGSDFKVGISWRGGKDPEHRYKRSTTLDQWKPVLKTPGLTFVSLQHGESTKEVASFNDQSGLTLHNLDELDPLTDVDGFAALIAALDLVISVDNSTVHLAGALGKQVWTLLPFVADWRWQHTGSKCDWYSGMSLWRQSQVNVWDDVFERLAAALTEQNRIGFQNRFTGLECSMTDISTKQKVAQAVGEHCRQAGLLQLRGNHSAAVAELKHALVAKEDPAHVYELLAESLAVLGETNGAIACYQQVLQLDSKSLNAYRGWAGLLDPKRDAQLLASLYDTVHIRFDGLPRRLPDFACEIADNIFSRKPGDARVASIYSAVLDSHPSYAGAWAGLGHWQLKQRQLDAAANSYQSALEFDNQQAGVWHNLGSIHAEQKQWQQALDCANKAIEIAPGEARYYFNKANTLCELNDHEAAIDSYLKAIRIDPTFSAALNNLGSLYLQKEWGPQAIETLRRAADVSPQDLSIQNNLGHAWNLQGDLQKSAACFQRVLAREPANYSACYSLARVYQKQHRLPEAEGLFRRAIAQIPTSPNAQFHLGCVLKDLNKYDEAIASYKRAIECQPTLTAALYELGNVYQHLKQYESAQSYYETVLEQTPDDVAAMISLGNVHKFQDNLAAAAVMYRRILDNQPERAVWTLWTSTLFPTVMTDSDEITRYRNHLDEQLTRLADTKPDLTPADINGYTCPPPYELQFHGLDNRPLKETYAKLFLPSFQRRPRQLRASGRPQVGIVVTGGHQGVFLRCMRGILDRLKQVNYQLVLICSKAGADLARQELQADRIEILEVPSLFVPALECVEQARFDVLYYWEIGSDITNYFLPFFGLANVQCTGWGVPDTSGIPAVDYYLSSSVIETPQDQQYYSEQLLLARTLLTWQDRNVQPVTTKERGHWGLSEQETVYLCVQQVRKLHPDFDHLVAGVLRNDPRGRVALMEDRENYSAKRLLQRMSKTIPDVVKRVSTIPYQSVDDYRSLLSHADVLLDTPHFGGGVTTYDCLAIDKPIVTLPGRFRRSRYATACYTMMEMQDCIASSAEEYVAQAVRLGSDSDYRRSIAKTIAERKDVLFENQLAVEEYDRLFEKLADESRQN